MDPKKFRQEAIEAYFIDGDKGKLAIGLMTASNGSITQSYYRFAGRGGCDLDDYKQDVFVKLLSYIPKIDLSYGAKSVNSYAYSMTILARREVAARWMYRQRVANEFTYRRTKTAGTFEDIIVDPLDMIQDESVFGNDVNRVEYKQLATSVLISIQEMIDKCSTRNETRRKILEYILQNLERPKEHDVGASVSRQRVAEIYGEITKTIAKQIGGGL